jgi:hypothetical protein
VALLPPLATVAQLGALLGQDLSGRLDQATVLLDMASDVVRGYTKQEFTLGTTTMTVPLRRADPLEGGHLAEVVLPQRPVLDVTSVLVDGTVPTDWWWRGDRVYLPHILWRHGQHHPPRASVTYEHGFDPVPGEVATVALQSALRVLVNPSQIRSEVVGGVSTVYAVPVGGEALGVLLTAAERRVLDKYRRRGGTVRLRS